MQMVQPKIISSPFSGSPCKPRIKSYEQGNKIIEEAYWYCPDSGRFITKGVVKITDKNTGAILSGA